MVICGFTEVGVIGVAVAAEARGGGRNAEDLAGIRVIAVDVAGGIGVGVHQGTRRGEEQIVAVRGRLSLHVVVEQSADERRLPAGMRCVLAPGVEIVVAGDGLFPQSVFIVGEDSLGNKVGGGAVLGDARDPRVVFEDLRGEVDREFDFGPRARTRDLSQGGAGIRFPDRGGATGGDVAGVEIVGLIGVAVEELLGGGEEDPRAIGGHGREGRFGRSVAGAVGVTYRAAASRGGDLEAGAAVDPGPELVSGRVVAAATTVGSKDDGAAVGGDRVTPGVADSFICLGGTHEPHALRYRVAGIVEIDAAWRDVVGTDVLINAWAPGSFQSVPRINIPSNEDVREVVRNPSQNLAHGTSMNRRGAELVTYQGKGAVGEAKVPVFPRGTDVPPGRPYRRLQVCGIRGKRTIDAETGREFRWGVVKRAGGSIEVGNRLPAGCRASRHVVVEGPGLARVRD